MIELFDRELVATQEAVGMHVLGQFRDLDDPDAFVWLRGFGDMSARAQALEAFYGGPVWREHRDAANATMIDSDNVLLLRPVDSASAIALDPAERPPAGATTVPPGMLAVTICSLADSAAAGFPELFARELAPALREAGGELIAAYATEHSPNNYPALPVREGEDVFIWLSRFADSSTHADHLARLDLTEALSGHLESAPETWRLTPTSRSLLH